jgi:response regulator NasT
MKRIIVSFANIDNANKIRDILNGQGFRVEGLCQSGAQVINMAASMDSGIVVCGYKLPDMVAPQLMDLLPENFDILMMLNPGQLELTSREDIFSISMPVNKADLINSLRMIFDMRVPKKKDKKPVQKKERSAEEKAIINEAKALLMDRNNMTEDQAHRFIQKTSMDSGLGMVDTARIILDR